MSRYLLSREASRDIQEIWTYVAQDSVRNANRLRDKLRTHLRRLALMPSLGTDASQYASGLRSSTVLKNYVVFYTTSKSGIVIVRILHGARDLDSQFGK